MIFIVFFFSQPNIIVLLSRLKKVAKVFLATNSDYNYTEVGIQKDSNHIQTGCKDD